MQNPNAENKWNYADVKFGFPIIPILISGNFMRMGLIFAHETESKGINYTLPDFQHL